MKNSSTIAVLTVFVLATGCAANRIDKMMESWVGEHKADLIAQWGPPDRVASDGRGGEVLIYREYVRTGQTPGRASTTATGDVVYTAPQQQGHERVRMFYANPEGIIYRWRWKGL